jgi:ethanolamine ammonia-lyase small subunit
VLFRSPKYELVDGEKVQVGEGPGLQFKESLGIGITYNIS